MCLYCPRSNAHCTAFKAKQRTQASLHIGFSLRGSAKKASGWPTTSAYLGRVAFPSSSATACPTEVSSKKARLSKSPKPSRKCSQRRLLRPRSLAPKHVLKWDGLADLTDDAALVPTALLSLLFLSISAPATSGPCKTNWCPRDSLLIICRTCGE